MNITTNLNLHVLNQFTVILYSLILPDAKDSCLKLVLYMKSHTKRNTGAIMGVFHAIYAPLGPPSILLLTQELNCPSISEKNLKKNSGGINHLKKLVSGNLDQFRFDNWHTSRPYAEAIGRGRGN